MRRAPWLLCAGLFLLELAAPHRALALKIVAIGDSITRGTTHSGAQLGYPTAQFDPQGGYAGRLQAALGGQAEVVARGLGGFTAKLWLDGPPEAPPWARDQALLEKSMPG